MGNCWAAEAKSSLSLEEVFPNGQSSGDKGLSGSLNKEFPNGLSSSGNLDEVFPNGQILPTSNLRAFSFSELKAATRNFRPNTVVWEGVFGNVYNGWVDEKTFVPTETGNGLAIAVKKLNFGWKPKNRRFRTSRRVRIAWRSDVNFLGRLSHPNLVKLLGYCWEEEEKYLFLVYEFIPKGSLEDYLFKGNSSQQEILSWSIRLKIAIGVARSLDFLHSLEKPIIYGDLKASNILLNWNYNAKVSYIGLGKIVSSDEDSDVKTKIIRSYGHAANDYFYRGDYPYEKSDVYCFGMVLLEILCGRRAFDRNRPTAQRYLKKWAIRYLSNEKKLFGAMAPRLEGQFPSEDAFKVAQLTSECLASSPKNRPSMKEVLVALERIELDYVEVTLDIEEDCVKLKSVLPST